MMWFHARLRWAVVIDGERLRCWEESDCFFRGADPDAAFARALEIGRSRQGGHDEDAEYVQTRLAAVVTLDCLGADPGVMESAAVAIMPSEPVRFDHGFRPEEVFPPPSF